MRDCSRTGSLRGCGRGAGEASETEKETSAAAARAAAAGDKGRADRRGGGGARPSEARGLRMQQLPPGAPAAALIAESCRVEPTS